MIKPGMLVVRTDTSSRRIFRVLAVYPKQHGDFSALIRGRAGRQHDDSGVILPTTSLRVVTL